MNDKQKIILGIGIALVLAMIVYPPFTFESNSEYGIRQEYGFLFDPPKYAERYWDSSINFMRLLNQFILAGIPVSFMYWVFRDKPPK